MSVRVYHFGYRRGSGHVFHGSADYAEFSRLGIFPKIDGGFAPGGDDKGRSERQEQGEAKLVGVSGWTLLSWWDRSGDQRRNSVSVLLAEGTFTFSEMLAFGLDRFPALMKRQPVPIKLVEP